MSESHSVTALLAALRSPEPAVRDPAAQQLTERYGDRLLGMIDRRLGGRLRGRVGAEDVLQDVLKSFFLRQQRGEFVLSNRAMLLGLLIEMASRKLVSACRFHSAARRHLDRERPLGGGGQAEELPARQVWDGSASDAELVELVDWMEWFGRQLTAELRAVYELLLEDRTHTEIAESLRVSVRTVERRTRLIRDRWEELMSE